MEATVIREDLMDLVGARDHGPVFANAGLKK